MSKAPLAAALLLSPLLASAQNPVWLVGPKLAPTADATSAALFGKMTFMGKETPTRAFLGCPVNGSKGIFLGTRVTFKPPSPIENNAKVTSHIDNAKSTALKKDYVGEVISQVPMGPLTAIDTSLSGAIITELQGIGPAQQETLVETIPTASGPLVLTFPLPAASAPLQKMLDSCHFVSETSAIKEPATAPAPRNTIATPASTPSGSFSAEIVPVMEEFKKIPLHGDISDTLKAQLTAAGKLAKTYEETQAVDLLTDALPMYIHNLEKTQKQMDQRNACLTAAISLVKKGKYVEPQVCRNVDPQSD